MPFFVFLTVSYAVAVAVAVSAPLPFFVLFVPFVAKPLSLSFLGVDLLEPRVWTNTSSAPAIDHWGKPNLKILPSQ